MTEIDADATTETEPGWLSPEDLELVRANVPIVYVDAVPVRVDGQGKVTEVGLLLRVAADGTINLLGRGSQCINTGGEKVYSGEVEHVLFDHPAVRECAGFGRPDERWGERVVAAAVTRAGEWVGPGWSRVARGDAGQAGMLAREQEISQLREQLKQDDARLRKLEAANNKLRDLRPQHESSIAERQARANEAHRAHAQIESQLNGARQRIGDLDRRAQQIAQESSDLNRQQEQDRTASKESRATLSGVMDRMAEAEARRGELDSQRTDLLARRDSTRAAAGTARSKRHELALATSSSRATLDSLRQSLERMDTQASQLQQRFMSLQETVAKATDPAAEFKEEMDQQLAKQLDAESRLQAARASVQELGEQYRKEDGTRQAAVQRYNELREERERARLRQQEVELSARNYERQAEAIEADLAALAEGLPERVTPDSWEADIDRLGVRITRLEP
ncbi:MAG: DUF4916 domain-containing protein, partial [Alcanivorax sp.]|nr:DUF4916 domain-containing protein [Alcanivorax sp.]